ncbi:hypothetical protein OAF63_05145 [Saprospiraceae bacterium]|nr:hypothetical protein [Saprospiraceae bacterium]
MELTNSSEQLDNGQVKIGARYHVLKEAGNGRYAKQEERFGVSLLAIKIENNSTDTLYFPGNLSVIAQTTALYMLEMDEAYEAIRQDIVERSETQERTFGEWLLHLPRFITNLILQTKANKKFREELDEYYLLHCYIAPGVTMIGLLGVDVKKDTPLKFVLDK